MSILNKTIGKTKGGSDIIKYSGKTTPFAKPTMPTIEEVKNYEKFLEARFGKYDKVLHELVSDKTHIDIYHFAPNNKNNCHRFVTGGMRLVPMNVPPKAKEFERCELMFNLPAEQKVDVESNIWSINLLRFLAHMPTRFDTWLCTGHTIPNGNPAEPYHKDTKLSSVLLTEANPNLVYVDNEKNNVYIWRLIYLYESELNYKLENGAPKLLDLFEKNGVTDILDEKRKPVV